MRGSVGAGKLRVLGVASALAAALAALAGGCSRAASSSLAPGQTPTPITPTVTPSAVPVLGQLTFGTFPSTWGGTNALKLCEDWAGLRADYVAHLKSDTMYQMEQWFSTADWQPAFDADSPLSANPAYGEISLAFGQATTTATAGIDAAKQLDRACAAADLWAGGPWAG